MTKRSAPPRAVILAAGLGSRLHPLTEDRPKPLVTVHGRPILHNALSHLGAMGVTDVALVVGYRKEAIQSSCGTDFHGILARNGSLPLRSSAGRLLARR